MRRWGLGVGGRARSFIGPISRIGAIFALIALASCGPKVKPLPMDPASRAARKAAEERAEREKKRQGSVVGEGISVIWQGKHAGGGVRRVVEAHAVTGQLNAKTKASVLNDATGTLYKENTARAHFKAPIVKGDENKHVVEATGGVTV